MNTVSQAAIHQGYQTLARVRPNASDDWACLDEMKHRIRQHLSAALLECSAIARDLTVVDADQLLVDLRHNFDPNLAMSPIQDAFADGFYTSLTALKDAGAEPISNVARLPSGAVGS